MQTPRWLALLFRLCAGASLAWSVAFALASPSLPAAARLATLLVIASTAWNAAAGLVATIALVSSGLLLAPAPVSAAELLVWAFVTAWLLALWRPLLQDRVPPGVVPALLYGGCVLVSWLGLMLERAGGVGLFSLPMLLLRSLPSDHVLFSSPEPETRALLQSVAGIALFSAAAVVAAQHTALRRWVATMVVGSTALLAVLTVAEVLRQWAGTGYGAWYLLRFVQGTRFSLHLADLNAAGSQYVLGALIAASLAVADRTKSRWWAAAIVLMLPALWLSGSRSAAVGAVIVGCTLIPLLRNKASIRVVPAYVLLGAIILAGVAVGGIVTASDRAEEGTASNALRLRSLFLMTSARMFASAPVFGVGVGHYHERSNEFMPPALREVYQHENAHNYFAQQFAELGLVGGIVFVWLVASVLRQGWRGTRESKGSDGAVLGLFVGSVGYLVTCVTGHPLLVPEAALPFWGAFGTLAGTASRTSGALRQHRAIGLRRIAVLALALLLGGRLTLQARQYALTTTPPGEWGFYELEKTSDGVPFVWMTRHGVFYIGAHAGSLMVPVQAPGFIKGRQPFVVDIEIGGKRSGTYELTSGRWTTIEIPIRERTSMPFRRVDIRANQSWTRRQDIDERGDDAPRSVMVGEIRWQPAGGR